MYKAKAVIFRSLFGGVAVILLGWITAFPARVQAQGCSPVAGNNLIYGTCTSSLTSQFGSTAYVDVSASTSSSNDICQRINTALLASTQAGTVFDARGISTNLTCASTSPSPWDGGAKAATLLLPIGTIVIPKSWAIHDQSQIIGQGPGQTILQAESGFTDPYAYAGTYFTSNHAMIHMGMPSTMTVTGKIAFAVRLLHLTLDGQGRSVSGAYIDGIDNTNAEEQSYVDDVTIQNILGNGLFMGLDPDNTATGAADGAADHSGPYTNIVFQEPTSTPISTTICVNVIPNVEPRGFHGITCLGNSASTATSAIVLDGNSTTIEDARIDGFYNGILVGSAGKGTQADVLFNITGTDSVGSVTNLINIDNTGTAPINLAIMGVSLTSSSGTFSINDQITGSQLKDTTVGMYLLGQPIGASITTGYSRFTTSPNFATWIVGKTTSAITNDACNGNGSLFSSSSGNGGNLWACVAGHWK